MFEQIQYFGGIMCLIAGAYNLIGSFVLLYLKGNYYSALDIIYNYLYTIAIAIGFTMIHYCK